MGQIVKVYKDGIGYQVLNTDNIGAALEAGDNISIDGNEISAVDTTYSAGTGLSLSGTTFSLNVDYGADLSLSIDPSTFVLTAQLKNQNGGNIGTAQTIDLPLESVVVSGAYNAQTKEVELTLQSGSVIRFSVADLVSGLQEELVVGNGINIDANNEISVDTSVIATKDYVDDSIAESVSSGPTAPSNPTQGMLRYDTVNDVLKSYDGTQWNEVGNESTDINTKAFYLSGTSDLTNAQAAYDWFSAGKNPIVMYNNRAYLLYAKSASQLIFQDIENSAYDQTSYTEYVGQKIIFTLSGNDVTAISYDNTSGWSGPILRTDVNYSTPYTPTYAGSPTTKQYVDNNDTYIGASAPTDNVVEGRLWYDTTDDILKVYDGSGWVITGKVYTAGDHINISNADVISTTGLQEELVAGDNITIETYCHPDNQGPCPDGYHIPTKSEWNGLISIMSGLGVTTGNQWKTYLHIPFAGNITAGNRIINQGSSGFYWFPTEEITGGGVFKIESSGVRTNNSRYKATGVTIRSFKNLYVTPTSSRTVIQGTLGSAGIFWDQTEGIISITDGTNGYTIMDKNLGATTVYNDGDTLSESNCGKYYQWGNNYGFPRTGPTSVSTTTVDASGYGPGNYYNSGTFIQVNSSPYNRSSVNNANLWGGVTLGNRCQPKISATDTKYTAGTGISIDSNNVISSTQANAEWGNIIGTLSDQTDLQNALNDKADTTDVLEKTNTTSYTPTGDYNPATKKYVDDAVSQAGGGDMLTTVYDPNGVGADAFDYTNFINTPTAGTGIDITNNVISADTTTIATKSDLDEKQDLLTAGDNITIQNECVTENNKKGPCPSGFHVPTYNECTNLINAGITIGAWASGGGDSFKTKMKMPYSGYRSGPNSANIVNRDYMGFVWTCEGYAIGSERSAYSLLIGSGNLRTSGDYRHDMLNIRPFKNEGVAPDSSWTTIYDGSSTATGAGIFHNAELGLISISTDGSTWTTIADKNLGATTVYNDGDTLSESNCGKYYQWGNNYGFQWGGNITNVSTTPIDGSSYGPNNYYYNETLIYDATRTFYDWSTVQNNNVWGGTSQGTFQDCSLTISAAGGATYLAGDNIDITNNVISAENVIKTDTPNDSGFRIEDVYGNYIQVDNGMINMGYENTESGYQSHNTTLVPGEGIYSEIYTESAGGSYENSKVELTNMSIRATFDYNNSGGDADTLEETYSFFDSPIGTHENKIAKLGDIQNVMSSGTTAPSNPTEGQLWYDTTNDVLKVYDGTNWNIVGDDAVNINTKTFFLTGTTGEANINTVNNAIAYYEGGKNPILFYKDESDSTKYGAYLLKGVGRNTEVQGDASYLFTKIGQRHGSNGWVGDDNLYVYKAGNYVEITRSVEGKIYAIAGELESAVNQDIYGIKTFRSAPVVPSKSTSAGNNPTAIATEAQVYLKQDALTAGTGIDITNNVISADTTVLATKQDIADLGSFEVVASLPSVSSANTKTIYLLGPIGTGADKYEEWIVTEDSQQQKQWTKIGETSVDLSGYATTSDLTTGLAAKQDTLTASTGINIDSSNNISNTLPGPTIAATAPTGTEGALWYDTTNDVLMAHDGTAWKEAGTQMKVLSYGHSTWQDFMNAYNENAIVYCRASSNSNPGTGNQGRMAFMAFVSINGTTGLPTEVEFQYYRSRSDHNTAANQLDQVFVYKLTSASGGTWTVTERNTGAKAVAGTGINLAFGSGNMTISADTTTLATQTDLNSKQDTLVSGTNIKTVNSNSLLGTGDITLNDVKVSAAAPSSPTEGMVWYDTTNDVLKSYNGSAWVEVGNDSADINTKTFYISSINDLTNAQAAYDWYAAGKNPIIFYNLQSYVTCGYIADTSLMFRGSQTYSDGNSVSIAAYQRLRLIISNGVVTTITPDVNPVLNSSYLRTDKNYSTPYTPQYDGSPATKKYVDDKSATVITEAQYGQIASPTTGKIYFIKES